MVQALNYLKQSASQTAGPYVHIGLAPAWAKANVRPGDIVHARGTIRQSQWEAQDGTTAYGVT